MEVQIYDNNLVKHHKLPYLYTRNLKLKHEFINNELSIKCSDPEKLYNLINKRSNFINDLHEEICFYHDLGILDTEYQTEKLNAFLKTFTITLYNEKDDKTIKNKNGIMIYQQNRESEFNVDLLEIPDKTKEQFKEIIQLLNYYDIGDSYFLSLIRELEFSCINHDNIHTLLALEFKNIENANKNSIFVLNQKQLDKEGNTIQRDKALENLNYFCNGILDKLDLSKSFVTGQGIKASLLHTALDKKFENRQTIIDLYYPPVNTKLSDNDHNELRKEIISEWDIKVISKRGLITINNIETTFTIEPANPVIIIVENDDLIDQHCRTIKKYIPEVKIETVDSECSKIIYIDDNPSTFRQIIIRKGTFSEAIRDYMGCYTGEGFYLSVNGLYTSKNHKQYQYYSDNINDIVMNYIRGFGVDDIQIELMVDKYIRENDIKISIFPFYKGKNIPYSLFSVKYEIPFLSNELKRIAILNERKKQLEIEKEYFFNYQSNEKTPVNGFSVLQKIANK